MLSLALLVKVVVLEVSRTVGGFFQSYSARQLQGPTDLAPVLSGTLQPQREAYGCQYSTDFGPGFEERVVYRELG